MTSSGDGSLHKEAAATDVNLRQLDTEIRELEFDSPAKEGATAYDVQDMAALGLDPTFRRRFKFIAMVGFCSTVVVAWQNTLTNFGFGLVDGGTGGIFWTFIFGLIGSTFLYLSLSELASCFPTAGGQYQWVVSSRNESSSPAAAKLLTSVPCRPSALPSPPANFSPTALAGCWSSAGRRRSPAAASSSGT